jgi:hypothetical protein
MTHEFAPAYGPGLKTSGVTADALFLLPTQTSFAGGGRD